MASDKPDVKEKPVSSEPENSNRTAKEQDKVTGSGSPTDSSRSLSQEALKPGDSQAMHTVAGKRAESGDMSSLIGKVEIVEAKKESKPSLQPEAITKAACEIHDAGFNRALWGWGWRKPDPEKIRNILEPMNEADRKALEKEYARQNNGRSLRDDLKERLGGSSDEYLKIEGILMRKDGKSDESGQVRTALNKMEQAADRQESRSGILNTVADVLSPGKGAYDLYQNSQDKTVRANAEADIRKSIGALTSEQIKEFKDTYKKNYGVDIEAKLLSDPKLSPETKEALGVLFKGVDRRTGSDPESVKNALDLANAGLKAHNIDIFKDAMQSASPEARKQFNESGGAGKIEKSFSGDDRELAKSYAERGGANLGHLIEGNHHWYHTNKDEINRLVSQQANHLDRQQFEKGRQLAENSKNGKDGPLTPEDKKALDFYTRVHEGLSQAGNPREVAQWEAKLMKSESVVSQVLDSHNDGGWFGWGAKTDKNRLMASVDNLSKEDWQRLHDNPTSELSQIKKALDTFAEPQDAALVMQRLTEKSQAKTYEESQTRGRRTVEQTFEDNKNNPANRVERLLKMDESERQAYLANKDGYKDRVDRLVESQTQQGMERFAAQRLLQEVAQQKKPDHADQALMSALKGDNPAQTAREIEAAFKENPALLKQPAAGESEAKLTASLRQALDSAVDKAGFGEQVIATEGGAYTIPGRQAEFAEKLFKTGSMPIELKVQLDKDDKLARYNDIINATPAEKQRLFATPPPDEATKRWQDSVLGSKEERQILAYAVQQGKMTDADVFRAYVKGSNTQPEDLKDTLSKMTPGERQNLANEYFTKYGSLVSADVIGKAPDNEKFRLREMLGPTDTNVRQVNLDAREERDRHTSVADPLMNKFWDKSQLGANEAQASMDKFVKEHAAEIEKLTPGERKQFNEAVANYQTAVKNYVDSKGAFGEAVVDSAITVAAIGGACFTGGTSLALLAAVGAGGAAFRVATMKVIEGTDFKDDPENVSRQAFKGFVSAELGFIGPQQLGLTGITKVGGSVAATTAEGVIGRVSRMGLSEAVFKEGKGAAQELLARELASVSRQGAIIGGKETEAIIQRVSTQALKDGATPAEKALFEQTVRAELKDQVTTGLRNKVINEAEAYLTNVAAASAGNAGAEVLATGVGLEDPATLWERVSASAVSGAAGATVFHCAFRGASAAFHGAKAMIGKDAKGLFAGEGTMVRHEDGSTTVVKEGERYHFQKGDKVVENLTAEGPAARDKKVDVDGRPVEGGRRQFIQDHFDDMGYAERAKAREAVVHDLKEVKASTSGLGADGKPLSVYEKMMSDPTMTDAQKDRVLDLLAGVREHYTSYRMPDGRMLADQEVNWIHTQGELARVMDSARANKLSAEETENALIASMFSDSAKFTDTASTKGNFNTHHLDGALAASEALERRGFPPERIQSITQAIREHQISPPEFMGFLTQTAIARNLKAQLDSGAISQSCYDEMKKVLDGMTVVGPDKMPRIKQIADINNAPLVKNGDGEWEVAFTPAERELMKLSGSEHWYVPHDPRYLADGKTADPEFARLPEAEQSRRLSTYKSSRALIDGDGIDNYATVGGASKIVKIRGPETFFPDKTVWDSVASIDKSYRDADSVLTPEGRRIAADTLAERNEILNDSESGIRAQMDNWLKAQGKDPSTHEIPFYNKELKYPEPLNASEQARLKEQQAKTPGSASEKAQLDAETRALKYKGLSESQINDFEFARQIRDQMTDFLRMAQRTDGKLPGSFEPSTNSLPHHSVKDAFSAKSAPAEMPPALGPVRELAGGVRSYDFRHDGRSGEVTINPDGTRVVTDGQFKTWTKYDRQGRVAETSEGYKFSYDAGGKLVKVEGGGHLTGTTMYTQDGTNWKSSQKLPDGRVAEGDLTTFRPLAVDGDGTIRYQVGKDVQAYNPAEGTTTVFKPNGRVEYQRANYQVESTRSRDLIEKSFEAGPRQERVQKLLKEFEERAAQSNMPESERALFYQQVNRMLSEQPGAVLSQAERANLAEQVINHAAHPTTVDQGQNNTCNVTTVENRLYTREPSKIAQIVADASLTGKYTTASGETIDLNSLANGVRPDFEARKSLKLQEKGNGEVKVDGYRDWSSQLVERTLANSKWARESVLVSNGRILDESAVLYDANHKLVGKVQDSGKDLQLFYDKDGKRVESYKPGMDVYTQNKKLITGVKEEDLVFKKDGTLLGTASKSKVEKLYDDHGKELSDFGAQTTRAFDKNGKLLLEQVATSSIKYDKSEPGYIRSAKESVYVHQMGRKVGLRDGSNDLIDSPNIYSYELHGINQDITGHSDRAFVINRADAAKHWSNQIDIKTSADLENALIELQRDGNLPGVLMVHTGNPPFSKLYESAGFMGGWHVVNVQGYDPVSKTLKVSNQWGSHADFEGGKGVPLETMFNAMQEPPLKRLWKTVKAKVTGG
jgi:YD repeat-containing protein